MYQQVILQTSMTLNVKSRYKIMLTYTHVHMFAVCYMFASICIVQTRIKHIDAFISQSWRKVNAIVDSVLSHDSCIFIGSAKILAVWMNVV